MSLLFVSQLTFSQATEEELVREAAEVQKEAAPQEQSPEAEENPPVPKEGDLGVEPYKIAVNANISMSYVFAESPDSFVVKYDLNLEGEAKNKVDVIKGNGKADASIQGFLAKWPTGGCKLTISMGEVPFEMIFTKLGEESVRVNTKLVGDVLEKWQSNCTFADAPGAKFNTSGNEERWMVQIVQKAEYILRDIKLPIDRLHKQTTTVTADLKRFMIADPPLGSAEVEGKLTLQVIPES